MDIRCTKCGEPWDFDCLHEEVYEREYEKRGETPPEVRPEVYEAQFNEVRKDFYARGCEALRSSCSTPIPSARDGHLAELAELLGDDVDGYAAMVEDFEFGGLL